MKIRIGYVSNSSSSSFILDGEKYTVEQVTKIIELGLQIEKVVNDACEYKTRSIDKICTVREVANCDSFIQDMKEFYCYDDNNESDSTYAADFRHESKYIKDGLGNKKCIIVDSVGDNSIPWRIQEILESIAAHRQHWG